MMSKENEVEEAARIVTKCRDMRDKLQDALATTQVQKDHAEQRLKELQESLPGLLAGQLFDEVSAGEIAEVKAEITELQESINDAPLVIQGLELRASENDQAMTKASKVLERGKAEVTYDKLKAQLKVKYTKEAEGYLRQCSRVLGYEKHAEAEAFLRKIRTAWEDRPIAER